MLPPNAHDHQFPLLLFVQGSAWRKQNMAGHLVQLLPFCKRGYVVAMVEYRSSKIAGFPAQIEDTKKALHFMVGHQKEFHIDPERIFLWGDSSGANTALSTGLTLHNNLLEDDQAAVFSDIQVRGIIDFYGPINLLTMNDQPSIQDHMGSDSPEGAFIGHKRVDQHPELAQKTSPLHFIRKDANIPPIFIIHGDHDRIVPFEQSVELYRKLKAEDKQVVFYQLKGADHGDEAFYKDNVYDLVEKFIHQNS
ncbi:alpha/beta hydrolase [Lactobacillus selangorensis]|nr:alpha/beta hydrolase [Lactobacillus selangorensis]